jgi:hypothetical protein
MRPSIDNRIVFPLLSVILTVVVVFALLVADARGGHSVLSGIGRPLRTLTRALRQEWAWLKHSNDAPSAPAQPAQDPGSPRG